MSLRDFNNAPFSDDPTALHNAPSGNGAGLKSFHTTQPEDIEPNNMPKIVGAVVVALMVGVAGVALYAHSGNQPKPVVAASNQPPAQPASQPAPTAMTPDASTTPPAAQTPAPAPAAAMTPAEKTPAPVKSASITKKKHVASSASKDIASSSSSDASSAAATRMSADSSQSTVQPQQQQAVTQPTAPQPSPSDVATNNTRSGAAVPSGANTASDIPAAPPALQQSAPAANPAPEQQTAPAPTQPSGQVAQ
jgi:hypothetical protein